MKPTRNPYLTFPPPPSPLFFFFLLSLEIPKKHTFAQARLNHANFQHTSQVIDTYEEGTRQDDNVIQGQATSHTHTHVRGTYSAPMQRRRLTTYHTLAYIKMLPMIALKKKKKPFEKRTDITSWFRVREIPAGVD